jgi:hypothetical protein
MKKVICINDKNLPRGASVKEGQQYHVEEEYSNFLDQQVYIIKGVPNKGTTRWGMKWIGYDATRFQEVEDGKMEYRVVAQEKNFAYN